MADSPDLLKVCLALYLLSLEAERYERLLHASSGDVGHAERVHAVVRAVKGARL